MFDTLIGCIIVCLLYGSAGARSETSWCRWNVEFGSRLCTSLSVVNATFCRLETVLWFVSS